jgi:hypothetical protein
MRSPTRQCASHHLGLPRPRMKKITELHQSFCVGTASSHALGIPPPPAWQASESYWNWRVASGEEGAVPTLVSPESLNGKTYSVSGSLTRRPSFPNPPFWHMRAQSKAAADSRSPRRCRAIRRPVWRNDPGPASATGIVARSQKKPGGCRASKGWRKISCLSSPREPFWLLEPWAWKPSSRPLRVSWPRLSGLAAWQPVSSQQAFS